MEESAQNISVTPKPNPLTTVTPLSKTLALILFIALPFLGFFLGIKYRLIINTQPVTGTYTSKAPQTSQTSPANSGGSSELKWQSLTVGLQEGAVNKPARMVLSGMGHLATNKFESVDNYQLAVYPSVGTDSAVIKLNYPLKLKYDLSNKQLVDTVKSCNLDIKTLSFYTNTVIENPSGSFVDGVEKIPSNLNTANNILEADLSHLGKYQQYGVFTDIIIGAAPSNYLLGCGSTAQAYLEKDLVVFKGEGYRFKLPSGVGRPLVSEGLINYRVVLPLGEGGQNALQLISMENWQNLQVRSLGGLKYPGYEMADPSLVTQDEKIDSEHLTKTVNRDYMEIISSKSDSTVYRLITTYSKGAKVLMFELSVNKSVNINLLDGYIKTANDIAGTVEDL